MEDTETIEVTLNATSSYTVDPSYPAATMDLYDDEPAVAIWVNQHANEDGTEGQFVIYRWSGLAHATTVHYTVSGTATNGVDYTMPASITIPVGENYVTLPVTAINDANVEDTETIEVTLNATSSYTVDPSYPAATMDLYDDEPAVAIWVNQHANEDGTEGQFVIYRWSGLAHATTVNYTVSGTATNGVDYTLPASITIPVGENHVILPVTAISDANVEDTETIEVTLNAASGYTVDPSYPSAELNVYDSY